MQIAVEINGHFRFYFLPINLSLGTNTMKESSVFLEEIKA